MPCVTTEIHLSRHSAHGAAEFGGELVGAVNRLIREVVLDGGAVGHPAPPSREQTRDWLEDLHTAIARGDAELVLAHAGARVEAMGSWRRRPYPAFRYTADLAQIMAGPGVRGLGLGDRVVTELIAGARTAGLETLALGVRGNNHGAIELYERLGFREWGRHPNVIVVGEQRFDDVRMGLELGRAPGVVLRGSPDGGPGWSPRRG